jgi:hypothetical protein
MAEVVVGAMVNTDEVVADRKWWTWIRRCGSWILTRPSSPP